MSQEENSADEASGWDAIDAALWPLYGGREPWHVGTIIPYALGGPDPVHGISAYLNVKPQPHLHFITYGFSELWAKKSTNPAVSGFGFELTFRPTCEAGVKRPPNWALNFLQNMGRYIFDTGNTFGVGHTLPLNGPIEQGSSTLVHAVSFARDPQLPPIDTPNGRLEFLQVVGITMDELTAIQSWDASAFLELRRRQDPLLLTDLSRSSWMKEPAFADEVARRTRQEGSSCAWLALVLECETDRSPACVRVQTIAAVGLAQRLMGRLPFGKELTLNGKHSTAVFKPGDRSELRVVEGAMIITLREEHARELAQRLQPHVGVDPVPGVKDLMVEVVRTEIKDKDGNVVEVVE